MDNVQNIQEYKDFKTPEKILQRNSSLPLYSTLFLSNLKSKYKIKKIYRFNSLSKNESTETSGLTRINSNNFSNMQLVNISNKKPKKKVSFVPSYRLVNYIYFDPKKSVFNNDINEENDGNKNEEKAVCTHCTCIIF